ncbi:MAG: hypothetical protein VYD19_04335, partial [Myxococcota bacterium]|nr:hypothetical protein [Myxococcota bacterium]
MSVHDSFIRKFQRWWRRDLGEPDLTVSAEAQQLLALDALAESAAPRLRDWGSQRGRSSMINMTGEERSEDDDPSVILTLLEEGAARVLGSERRRLWRARGGLPWSEAFQRILIQWLQLSERQRVPFSGLLAEQLRLLELEPLRWNTARRGRPQAIPPVEGLLFVSLVGGLALAMVLDQGALLGLLFGFFSGVILTRRPRYKCP